MSYAIDARLQEDRARLQIIESETGRVRLAWDCSLAEDLNQNETRLCVQRLFRELMLISVLDLGALHNATSD